MDERRIVGKAYSFAKNNRKLGEKIESPFAKKFAYNAYRATGYAAKKPSDVRRAFQALRSINSNLGAVLINLAKIKREFNLPRKGQKRSANWIYSPIKRRGFN